MARFRLSEAFHHGSFRWRAGQVMVDSQANALPGDHVWTGMSSSTITAAFQPIDGLAVTMRNASPYASVPAASTVSGVNSVD
jgi:hypothetical protein